MAGSSSKCILKVLLFSFIDMCLTITCLCWHGPSFSLTHLQQQFSQPYSFYHSTIDLFLLAVVRIALLSVGLTIFLLKNDAEKVLNALSYMAACLSILFCCFSPTKLLALKDLGATPPGSTDVPLYVGDWAILVENFVFSFLVYYLWLGLIEAVAKRGLGASASGYESLREGGTADQCEEAENKATPKVTVEIIARLLHYVSNEWIWHVSGFTWLFIYSMTRIFVPYYTGQVIASVVSSGGDKYAALIDSVKLMIVISVVSAVAGGFRGGSFEYAYARINRAVRSDLFSSLVRQDVAFYDTHKTGEVISRLSADTQTMSDTVSLNINIFLRNTVQMAGSMIFMMALCWKLSLIPFVVVPIILMASKIFGVYYDFLSNKTQETVAHSNDVAEEVLSTMRTVRSFACEEAEANRFYSKLNATLDVTKKKAVAYVGYLWVSELFQTLINIAVLWYGGHLVLTNQLNKDLLVSFLLYQMQLTDNIRQLGEVWTGLMQSVGASRKVFEYIDRQPDIETDGSHAPDHISGHIEFQNVHFSYPSRPNHPVLKGLSFSVQPGQVIALVGPSGSGKSSCISLLEHFYKPTSGRILVDGVNIKDYEHHLIHNKIALVGQEPVLFARSVADNIAYGMEVCTTTDVVEAAKLANAHSFIVNTCEQYDTNVGEKGSQMSGGQKQRIAIARALVRQPAILLLDEATSALDTESEHLVQEAIYNNLKGKSVILIAHRLSTVEKADKIVVISKGIVEQIGSHEELLNQEGIYRSLVERQMIGGGTGVKNTVPTTPEMAHKQTLLLPPSSDAGAASTSQILSISPRSMTHSLLATSFTQSTSGIQSK